MKQLLVIALFVFCGSLTAQVKIPSPTDSMRLCSSEPIAVYPSDYMRKYNQLKIVIVKVYPYALYAADVLDEINQNAEAIEKRRKQNKFYKDSYQQLKDDFKYVFYELYTHEGIMLMKLVHRETGMTVYEIAETYRGKKNAEVFELMGKIWDQDLKVKFDALGEDKIAEHVISDIQRGIIPFKSDVVLMSKEDFKVEQEKDRQRKKQRRQNTREHNQKKKEEAKEAKQDERQSN